MGWGNFGAPPKPPQRGSNARRSAPKAVTRIASVSGCGEAPRPVDRSIASVTLELCCSASERRLAHTSAMADRTVRKAGRPWRASFG